MRGAIVCTTLASRYPKVSFGLNGDELTMGLTQKSTEPYSTSFLLDLQSEFEYFAMKLPRIPCHSSSAKIPHIAGYRLATCILMAIAQFPARGNLPRVLVARSFALLAGLLGRGTVLAQRPKDNVSEKRHPNLAAAQRLSTQAYEKILAAQKANEWDMRGHAQKAKELLEQANNELKQAAEAANKDAK